MTSRGKLFGTVQFHETLVILLSNNGLHSQYTQNFVIFIINVCVCWATEWKIKCDSEQKYVTEN